jgi:parallel beta-helix repeat protein
MTKGTKRGAILALIAGTFLGGTIAVAKEVTKTVHVDCSQGKTIAKALDRGDERNPLLVLVRGVCNESVWIDRADVTLRGETGFGGAINGPDPALDTLTLAANRVAIEDLVISGGRNGITVTGAGGTAIRATTVQSTGRTGIVVLASSSATIDGSTVQSNPRDGVVIEGSQGTVINSTVRQNARFGIFVGTGAAGRIGLDSANNAAGNTISQNGATGLNVSFGGGALIANNSITLNGQDLTSTSGRSGISVVQATADIAGSNTIADNTGQGIFVRSGSVQIGNPSFAFSSVNTITGNGDAVSAGGVFAFLGSALVIRDAVISGNRGFGVGFSLRSHGQLFNSQIQNSLPAGANPGDGIRLIFGAGLLVSTPNSSVTGNAGAGILCTDGESSVLNTGFLGLAGNGVPGTPGCTAF